MIKKLKKQNKNRSVTNEPPIEDFAGELEQKEKLEKRSALEDITLDFFNAEEKLERKQTVVKDPKKRDKSQSDMSRLSSECFAEEHVQTGKVKKRLNSNKEFSSDFFNTEVKLVEKEKVKEVKKQNKSLCDTSRLSSHDFSVERELPKRENKRSNKELTTDIFNTDIKLGQKEKVKKATKQNKSRCDLSRLSSDDFAGEQEQTERVNMRSKISKEVTIEGRGKAAKKPKKQTKSPCIINELSSEDFAEELRNLFNMVR